MTSAKPVPPATRPSGCTAAPEQPFTAGRPAQTVHYAATGTGSYTAPDGTGATYPFPPSWSYAWRPAERLVELSATDALGTWGIAAGSSDEVLSRISAVYLTAPNGRGGSVTFTLRLAAPLALAALPAGGRASGRAADGSVLVSVHRPSAARSFELALKNGPCPAGDGIGAGTISLDLGGAQPPWSTMSFRFDVRLEDDRLSGQLDLRKA